MSAPLVAVFLVLTVVMPAPATLTAVDQPFCARKPGIPQEAYDVEEFVRTHNFSPPPGLKGNSTFDDRTKDLPSLFAPFREYDIYPGRPRRAERVVLSPSFVYASWYTPDHYSTFEFMFPPGCLILPTRLFS